MVKAIRVCLTLRVIVLQLCLDRVASEESNRSTVSGLFQIIVCYLLVYNS